MKNSFKDLKLEELLIKRDELRKKYFNLRSNGGRPRRESGREEKSSPPDCAYRNQNCRSPAQQGREEGIILQERERG